MGMYDDIICEYPLPDGFDATDVIFQTKDLDCMLYMYKITKNGDLLCREQEFDIDRVIEKEKTYKWEPVEYHGDIELYGHNLSSIGKHGFTTYNDEPYWTRTYIARFTENKLSRIMLINDKSSMDNSKHMTEKDFRKIDY